MSQDIGLSPNLSKHQLPGVGLAVDFTPLSSSKGNYEKIDKSIETERDLRRILVSECSSFRNKMVRKIVVHTLILLALWAIAIPAIAALLYYLFDTDTVFMPIIIAFIIVSPLILLLMSLVTANYCNTISKFKIDKERAFERKVTAIYANLLCGQEIHDFLDIPHHFDFDDAGLPFVKHEDNYFIRYIAPQSGKKYHKKQGCCGAISPVHIYSLSAHYSPCSKCNAGEQELPDPEWYKYYQKVKAIIEKYGFEMKMV